MMTGVSNESMTEGSKDLVNSYVQSALQKISGERREIICEEVRKREIKIKQKK